MSESLRLVQTASVRDPDWPSSSSQVAKGGQS